MNSLDMAELLSEAYNLADRITDSDEAKRYIHLKRELGEDEEAQRLIRQFQEKKERFEEAQRFGHFHPDYHAAKEAAEDFSSRLREHPLIREYLEVEEKLDRLLGEVSRTLARSVSEEIKVPVDAQELDKVEGGRRKSCG
ncbi:YlbF family regulator [Salinithrix halophila]|uniref:YlbF family regulator n=1 Tax=Salinithrix halophila TaxID=1485204 RepID=A0ABV8JDA5_9BACL